MNLKTVVVAVTLIASACSVPVSSPEIDAPQPPPAWTSPLTADLESHPRWWEAFEAPGLTAAIETALQESPTLEAQRARLEAAAAQARIAGAQLKPQFGLGVNGARRRQNFIGLPIPGSGGDVLTSTSTTVGVSLDTSWEIDLWGRGRAARAAAESGVVASERDLAAAQLSVAAQTAKVWTALAEAAAQVRLAQETVDNRDRAAKRIDRRFELGIASALQVRLARSEAETARADFAQSEQAADALRRQLETLLRGYPEGSIEAGPLPELPPLASSGLPAELIARRPDLQALEARLAQAGFGLAEAKRSLYPRLSLNGSIGRTGSEMQNLLESDFDVWSLAGGLLQPLFQGGRLRAGVDLAEARVDELVALYVQTLLEAYREVETRLAAESTLADLETALARAEEESRAAAELAEREYARGVSDYLTVLRSQTDNFNAARRRLSVRAQRLTNRIDLHLALGNGLTIPANSATDDSQGNSEDV